MSVISTSSLFTFCSIGLILSVARNVEQMEGKAPVETEIELPDEENSQIENGTTAIA